MYIEELACFLIMLNVLGLFLFCFFLMQEMMDREKKDKLPTMQVGFIDSICLPVYEVREELL